MVLTVPERVEDRYSALQNVIKGHNAQLWTALPGIIHSFDPAALTVQVQPAIKALNTGPDLNIEWVDIPLLPDVPVVFPRGGGYELTFPIAQGDECLVVFSSRCIDNWWQQGGVQQQRELRMHDLSDGFALVGPWSQKTKISNLAAKTVQLRTDDGKFYAEIDHDNGKISTITPNTTIVQDDTAQKITMTAGSTTILQDGASNRITLTAGSTTLVIDGSAGTITTTGQTHLSMNAPTIDLN